MTTEMDDKEKGGITEMDDISGLSSSPTVRWDRGTSIRLGNVIWEQILDGDPSWLDRFVNMNDLVNSFEPDKDVTKFFDRQLCLTVFDVNRMEGTISPDMENDETYAKIKLYLTSDCIAPPVVKWNSEGGRD